MPHSLITPKRHEANAVGRSNYGATFVAGSLHPLWPSEPIAATRNQYFFPLVRFWIVLAGNRYGFCVGGPPLDFKQEDFKVFSYMC